MAAPAFDALATAHDLEAAGLERRQAEAGASAIGNVGDRATTKADLAALRADFCRALWMQGGAIVAALLAGIAPALAGLIRGSRMVTVATFDTCAAAKALREAGFDEAQAEAAVAMARDAVTEGGAAKAALASLETRLTVRFYDGLLAAGAAVVALMKPLPQAAP